VKSNESGVAMYEPRILRACEENPCGVRALQFFFKLQVVPRLIELIKLNWWEVTIWIRILKRKDKVNFTNCNCLILFFMVNIWWKFWQKELFDIWFCSLSLGWRSQIFCNQFFIVIIYRANFDKNRSSHLGVIVKWNIWSLILTSDFVVKVVKKALTSFWIACLLQIWTRLNQPSPRIMYPVPTITATTTKSTELRL